MLICNSCGSKFEKPHVEYESRGEYWGFPAYEAVGYCPNCEGDDYEEYYEDMEDDENGDD